MKAPPENTINQVDLGFMDARIKLLDIAAFLDRVERAGQEDDFRVKALRDALRRLDQSGATRARDILRGLSDPTEEPIPAAHVKGAAGAWGGAYR
jgi:hypothetical protein